MIEIYQHNLVSSTFVLMNENEQFLRYNYQNYLDTVTLDKNDYPNVIKNGEWVNSAVHLLYIHTGTLIYAGSINSIQDLKPLDRENYPEFFI